MKPEIAKTPSIVGREITRFRGGQPLRYAELTGREKRDYLFDEGIRATAYDDGELPDVAGGITAFAQASFKSVSHHLLGQTLTRESDELEEPKLKLFHTYGAAAEVVFQPAPGTPYTGLFAEEVHGLARFSYAGPVLGVGIVPGFALKVPLDGDRPSRNAVVMHMLDRQSSKSVFENIFSNLLPAPKSPIMKVVKHRFESVVEDGRGLHQPVDHFADVRAAGGAVEGELRAPHRLLFAPTRETRQRSNAKMDFREDLAQNVPANTRIYDVFGLDEQEEKDLVAHGLQKLDDLLPHARPVGSLTTESPFVASSYGDYRLFFQHSTRFLRPEVRG